MTKHTPTRLLRWTKLEDELLTGLFDGLFTQHPTALHRRLGRSGQNLADRLIQLGLVKRYRKRYLRTKDGALWATQAQLDKLNQGRDVDYRRAREKP